MKFTAIQHGFNVVEIPIIFTDRTEGTSKMSTRIFREAFLGVIQIKINSWFRKYPTAKKVFNEEAQAQTHVE